MEMQVAWSDRGHALELGPAAGRDEASALVAASKGGSLAVSSPVATVWLALRGDVEIECRDGRYQLRAGEWLSLEREARPVAYTGSTGLVLGLVLSGTLQAQLQQSAQAAVFPGHGAMPARSRKVAFDLWRRSAPFVRNDVRTGIVERQQWGQLLRFLAGLQGGLRDLVDRCPGRSLRRKRQVFSRMQRASLHLQGNLGRAVRISELAGLTNMSIWYFTKTFHALYGEGPQAASTRIRLRHAAKLLLETRWSISEVGAACGFENNCSFSRAFRAQFGTPPSLYRLHGGRLPANAAHPAGMDSQAAS